MTAVMSSIDLKDVSPQKTEFLQDVLTGLQGERKSLPCKYFYDDRGSRLFEQICKLDEYYLTRTELAVMRRYAVQMAKELGPGCAVVEFGSGSGVKTAILLEHLQAPAAYIPVDISREHLQRTARQLDERYPHLLVKPVCADFTRPFRLPALTAPSFRSGRGNGRESARRTVVYFPGSTIGNFGPADAVTLLQWIGRLVGIGGGLLIGVDLHKSPEVLIPAYNDPAGVTAEFNRNLLVRINRELGADFDVDLFAHRAVFNEAESRIEMHLVCRADYTVRLNGVVIGFRSGETIHTENSYKYALDQFAEIAEAAGFRVQRIWHDPQQWFSVQYLTRRGER